jgi:hypothetical protein
VIDPAERLVNLALFIAAAPEPVTAARVQAQVAGYPEGQAEGAFLRMFERDKEDLLAAGIALEVTRSGESEAYRLDRGATFAGEHRGAGGTYEHGLLGREHEFAGEGRPAVEPICLALP